MENMENSDHLPETPPPRKKLILFAAGRRELIFAALTLLGSLGLVNCLFFGASGIAGLGFSVTALWLMVCAAAYLGRGHMDGYSAAVGILSAVLAAGFARSDDDGVKFLLLGVLFFSVNLEVCLLSRQNRRNPGGIASALDAPRAFFMLGIGGGEKSLRGLQNALRRGGRLGHDAAAVGLGLLISIPLLAVLAALLSRADAAFEGLTDLLPAFDFGEIMATLLFGCALGAVLYSRGVTARQSEAPEMAKSSGRGISAITAATVLTAVGVLYCVYLISQLAYISGGFSGILPAGYTMAEYARRGFFEMAWLCALNIGIVFAAAGLVKGEKPIYIRLCCLFLCLITLFLVASASAKMLLYIEKYGLTRLRVLTEIFMLWLALVTAAVAVWLFAPKLPYMKAAVLAALVFCAVTLWVDVDTQVAKYNVRAYQSGALEAVDVGYLNTLSAGAVPYLQALTEDDDPEIAEAAEYCLRSRSSWDYVQDWREWNWAKSAAQEILEPYRNLLPEQAEDCCAWEP